MMVFSSMKILFSSMKILFSSMKIPKTKSLSSENVNTCAGRWAIDGSCVADNTHHVNLGPPSAHGQPAHGRWALGAAGQEKLSDNLNSESERVSFALAPLATTASLVLSLGQVLLCTPVHRVSNSLPSLPVLC